MKLNSATKVRKSKEQTNPLQIRSPHLLSDILRNCVAVSKETLIMHSEALFEEWIELGLFFAIEVKVSLLHVYGYVGMSTNNSQHTHLLYAVACTSPGRTHQRPVN